MTDKEKDLERLKELEKQQVEITSEMLKIKRKYKLDIYCCKDSENSNGWSHNGNCVNWVMPY